MDKRRERGIECEDGRVRTDRLRLAKAGDEEAFAELTTPYRRELHVHCYRILGSLQDAEDALQETLLAAWRGLARFEERASIRTWLYTIATNRALNMLRSTDRRHREEPQLPFELPEPVEVGEPVWLEPYPDHLLDEHATTSAAPEARYETKEAISLAFITALQLLPARQRAVLVLRDVLGYRAAEVATILESSDESVTSALKRARATLEQKLPKGEAPPHPDSATERELVERLTAAFVVNDVDGIVSLLADDVRLNMPPIPLEYRGIDQAAQFLTHITGFHHDRRLIETRANGQPALAMYARDPGAPIYRSLGLLVITLTGGRVAAITRFDTSLFPQFELPRTLPT
jgi:RNA polymerase sigma-70 factor, ECF subfamily